MFLTARLFALFIYCILLFIFCSYIIKTKYIKFTLFIYLLFLSIIAFFYVPYETADLYRFFQIMHVYSILDFSEIFELMKQSATPLTIFYFYCISFLCNDHLLPAINTFITFYFCFFILYKVSIKYKLKGSSVSLILLFFMSSGLLMPTLSNLRTMLALSIITYCIYLNYFHKTSILKQIPLLIIAILFHTSAVLLSMIYLIYISLSDILNAKKFLNLLINIFIIIIYFTVGNFYLEKAYTKGQNYIQATIEGTAYFYIWELIICLLIIFLVVIIVALFVLSRPYFKHNLEYNEKQFIAFLIFLSFIDLFLFKVEYTSGVRLNFSVTILCIPLLSIILSNKTITQKQYINIKNIILLFSLLILILTCSRGSLCSLKFWE